MINKADILDSSGEASKFIIKHFDFIQYHIRDYAIKYGASVITTSATKDKNLNVLYQYMLHRLYKMKFPH